MPEENTADSVGEPKTSESEEMYLLTVVRAEEDGHQGSLPVAELALTLGVSAASANEMVRKLERRGLVTYERYRGVDLTVGGRRIAARVLRVRRLWARFLADRLGMAPDEADALACRLEHVTPDAAIDRLDRFLDHPSVGPMGRPIPPGDGEPVVPIETLAGAAVGSPVEVVSIEGDRETAAFLADAGIRVGAVVSIRARAGTTTLVAGDMAVAVGSELARSIAVRGHARGA
jgi:DtxR family Mn-dependent transcriptional regulator